MILSKNNVTFVTCQHYQILGQIIYYWKGYIRSYLKKKLMTFELFIMLICIREHKSKKTEYLHAILMYKFRKGIKMIDVKAILKFSKFTANTFYSI